MVTNLDGAVSHTGFPAFELLIPYVPKSLFDLKAHKAYASEQLAAEEILVCPTSVGAQVH